MYFLASDIFFKEMYNKAIFERVFDFLTGVFFRYFFKREGVSGERRCLAQNLRLDQVWKDLNKCFLDDGTMEITQDRTTIPEPSARREFSS